MNFDFIKPESIDNLLFNNYYTNALKFILNKELYISFHNKFYIDDSEDDKEDDDDKDDDDDEELAQRLEEDDNLRDDGIFNTKNKRILIINNGSFNPFTEFRNIINEYNLNITLQNEHLLFGDKIKNNIKGELNEENVTILTINPFLIDFLNNKYDIIIIHHASIYDNKLTILLNHLNNFMKEDSKIYFFYTICNQSDNKVNRKNIIRQGLKKITNLPIGKTKNIIELNEELNLISEYFIKKESGIFMKKKYLFYGEYSLYYFILDKNN